MPNKERYPAAKLLFGVGLFQAIGGVVWYLHYSRYFAELTDDIMIYSGAVPIALAWVARRAPVFASTAALTVHLAALTYLHWPRFGIVVNTWGDYLLQLIPLLLLIVAVLLSIRSRVLHETAEKA